MINVEINSLKGKWYVTIVGSDGDGTDESYMRVDGTFTTKMNGRRYDGTAAEGDGHYFESALAAETAASIHGHTVVRICPQED